MRLFDDVASGVEDPYFAHALHLAARGVGSAAPNPAVGCVVVRDGRIVGEGFHARAGSPHAEVVALEDAGEAARGAELYVTLEPCSHFGRTPPCTDAVIAAGIARVHVGMRDPSAEAGGGAEVLESAGVDVRFAEDPTPFARVNEGWVKRLVTGRPFVTAKVAMSLDGRVGFSPGERAFITGPHGGEVTRRLRMRADAVLVGAATVTADDPALTVRTATGVLAERQPVRAVVTRSGRLPAGARVFHDSAARTVVLAPEGVEVIGPGAGVDVIRHGAGLPGALAALGGLGVNEVLVEPGPRLFAAFWEAGLVDELVTVTAGGMCGVGAVSSFGGAADREGPELSRVVVPVETGIVGDVTVSVWRPVDAATWS